MSTFLFFAYMFSACICIHEAAEEGLVATVLSSLFFVVLGTLIF